MDYCALRRNRSILRPKAALKEEQIICFLLIRDIIQKHSLNAKEFFALFSISKISIILPENQASI